MASKPQTKASSFKANFTLKTTLMLSLCLLLLGCDGLTEPEEGLLLDCLLETFIDNYPGELDDVVIVSEGQGWTDSSTVLSISYCSRKFLYCEKDVVQTTFNGRVILYGPYVLPEPGDSTTSIAIDESRRMKTKLNWGSFDTTGLQSKNDIFMPPYDPPVAWVFIDNYRQCVEADPRDTSMIRCGVCEPRF